MKKILLTFIAFALMGVCGTAGAINHKWTKPNIFIVGDSITLGMLTAIRNNSCPMVDTTLLTILPTAGTDYGGSYLNNWFTPDCAVDGHDVENVCGDNPPGNSSGFVHLYQRIRDANATNPLDAIVLHFGGNDMTQLKSTWEHPPRNTPIGCTGGYCWDGNADKWIVDFKKFIYQLRTDFPGTTVIICWYYPWDSRVAGTFIVGSHKVECTDCRDCRRKNNQNRDYIILALSPWLASQNIPVLDYFHYCCDTRNYVTPYTFVNQYGTDSQHPIPDGLHIFNYSVYLKWFIPQVLNAYHKAAFPYRPVH